MENGPSLPACTFTVRESLVFKSPAVKLKDKKVSWAVWHRGQLSLLLWLLCLCFWSGWWRASTEYLFPGEEERLSLCPLYSRTEAKHCCKPCSGLPVSSDALPSAALICVPKIRGAAVRTLSTGLMSAHTFSKRELLC